jgi:thiamine biosynthesis lipoprotein
MASRTFVALLLAALVAGAGVACNIPEPDRNLRLVASATPAAPVPTPPGDYTVPAGPVDSSAPAAPQLPKQAVAPFAATRVSLEDKAMGTHIVLAAFTTPELDEAFLRPRLEKALAEIRRLEGLMTTWRDDSEISRINAAAGKAPVVVGAETLAVIQKSIWMSARSEGVFDITFEAMHGVWKFDQDHDEKIPPAAAVESARKLIDYRKIKVDSDKSSVMLEKAGMRMSLGGIAKGYAVDAAARVLEAEHLPSYFVQAGGDLYVKGRKPDGAPWRVGVRDPRGKDATDYFAMLEVEDHAFSTAGDYERGFVKDGKRYHHIIDPRTGYPATASRSVTIWAKDAFTADAIDDAVFILGAKKGLELVESIEDCGAVIVDAQNKVWISRRLTEKLHVLRPPTDGT